MTFLSLRNILMPGGCRTGDTSPEHVDIRHCQHWVFSTHTEYRVGPRSLFCRMNEWMSIAPAPKERRAWHCPGRKLRGDDVAHAQKGLFSH